MSGCGHEHEDGAYVLGALSPEDRVAFERHLPGCPDCARSVRELAGLPGLLARVPVEVLDPGELPLPVPDTLLPGLLRKVRRARRRRTLVLTGVAAATIAAVAVGTTVVVQRDDPPSTTVVTAAPEQFHQVAGATISGWVSLTPVDWGTRLDLTCSYTSSGTGNRYDDGWPTYTMWVTRTDGSTESVASWKGAPGKTVHISAGTAATRGEIKDVTVRTGSRTVLRLR